MSEWITAREAAELLGVHVSAIPKMIRRGELTPRARRRPSLRKSDVVALREHRVTRDSARQQPTERLKIEPVRAHASSPLPPDADHAWLNSDQAAAFMGVTRNAVNDRALRGRLPSQMHDRRRWFRQDHLELVKRADPAKRYGRLASR